jgi:peroxiredoxin/Tfp pilus assembly protein PilF
MKNIRLILIVLISIYGCSKQGTEVVNWKPGQPKAGEKVTVTFNPQRLVKTEGQEQTIFMVCKLIGDQESKTIRIPMDSKRKSWQGSVKTDPGTYLLRLKFEDQMDRVEDNDGIGWNIIIRDDKNNIAKNTHDKLGVIFDQERASGFVPNYDRAYQEFSQELALCPNNFDTWFDLWNLKLKKSNWSKQQIQQVNIQLDSLLQKSKQNADLLALAFNTYWKILKNPKTAVENGNLILTNFKSYPDREAIEYAMIFLKYGGNPEAVINELINFSQRATSTEYLKSAYYQLGVIFQNFHNPDESIKYFQKYIELAPNDVSVRLNLANIFLRKQDFNAARQMIDGARVANTDENYFQTNPWEEPQQRRAQLNLNQSQILSTEAALESALQNYPLAIQLRKKVIEQGTPFPAFEWSKIGDIYSRSGELDSAQQAYVKAVSINSAQEDAIDKLRFIYQLSTKDTSGFDSFLKEAIAKELKASAKPAPDFALTDLDGEPYQLSEQKGKVVILTFWDSWSSACQQEIPQLNALVEQFKDNQNVVFWAISVEAPISINKFIKENPFHYHLFHSGFEAKQLFKVIGFPTHVIIDPTGKIRFTHIGYSENIQSQLKKEILSILEEEKTVS